jgi:hypothetical protein
MDSGRRYRAHKNYSGKGGAVDKSALINGGYCFWYEYFGKFRAKKKVL